MASACSRLLRLPEEACSVREMGAAQQQNGFDCGAYSLVHAVLLAARLADVEGVEAGEGDFRWPPLLAELLEKQREAAELLEMAEEISPDCVSEFRQSISSMVDYALEKQHKEKPG
eukprot:scaffold7634_cov248-Pinguiococcus_pyrenoidosus.AAC.1